MSRVVAFPHPDASIAMLCEQRASVARRLIVYDECRQRLIAEAHKVADELAVLSPAARIERLAHLTGDTA